MKVVFSFLMYQMCCLHAYENQNAGLDFVPHVEIAVSETVIHLDYNAITELKPNEFSEYHDLQEVSLRFNAITTISPSAFTATQLETLKLDGNPLAEDLDLSAVPTLKVLSLNTNAFTAFPNITISGTATTLHYNNASYISEDNISTACKLKRFYWTSSHLQNMPNFSCESPILNYLQLMLNDMNENSNLTSLASIASSLRSLGLVSNNFRQFPRLPDANRRSLQGLWLASNQISFIPHDAIQGYKKLRTLYLQDNQISKIPGELLGLSPKIRLDNNPLDDWEACKWNNMLYEATSLTSLQLDATMSSLTWLPDISLALCNRSQHLTIILESIPGPCDCSVQWMADAVRKGCPVEFQTDALQCGQQLQDLSLTCPQRGVIFYTPTGSFTVQENEPIAPGASITAMTVLGTQAWVVYSSESYDLTAPHRILVPGRYSDGIDGFEALAAGLYEPLLSVSHDLSGALCGWDERLKLYDDDPATCLDVDAGVWRMNVTSDQTIHQLHVVTRHMDCQKRFHVAVSITDYSKCRTVHVCQLEMHSILDDSDEVTACTYTVPQVTGTLVIRLAAIYKGAICSISHN